MITGDSKWRRTRMRALTIGIAMCAVTLLWFSLKGFGSTATLDGPTQIKSKSVEKLERFRQQYAGARSIHIAADAQITLYGSSFRVGTGSYEYWAAGDQYKIKCHTDPQLGFLKDVDIAYDGKQYYYFDRGSSLLSYQHQDVSKTIGALPNPLFLPVEFLSNEDDSCPFCALRLSDFKFTNTRWNDRAALLEVKAHKKDENTGATSTDLEMPGGTKSKRPFKIRLRMHEGTDGKIHLVRIDQIGLDEKVLTSLSFDNFRPTALGEFPLTITSEGFSENSSLVFRMVYTVKTLEINQPLEESIFTVDFREAERVWDSDARKLVKEKKPGNSHP